MKKYILFSLGIMLLAAMNVAAQDDYNTRAKKYVDQYCKLAMAEQRRCGIPASITLGQGILETEAGISELMIEANNHFGIKCKNGWEGETFLHTDDAPNECFKKYGCAADSYKDHSDHLKRNQRYAPLFKLSPTDYASWAVCLKRCGYATNPQYAQRLIKIIEDFKLQEYTYSAMDSDAFNNYQVVPVSYRMQTPDTLAKPLAKRDTIAEVKPQPSTIRDVADSARDFMTHQQEATATPNAVAADTSKYLMVNGLKAFYAHKDELLHKYAEKYEISYPFLIEINDLHNAPLPFDMNVYLERKPAKGTHATHTVAEGENLLMIAQMEGIQLRSLRALNRLNPNEEPVAGSVLELQTPTHQKPTVKRPEIAAHTRNAIIVKDDSALKPGGDYIALKKENPQVVADTAKTEQTATPPAMAKTDTAETLEEAEPIPPPIAAEAPDTVVKAAPKSISEMSYEEIEAQQEKKDEFAKLKSELDKIVYADDSKLAVANAAPSPAPTAEKKPAAEPVQAKGNKFYTVKKGDTAFSIAKRNNITVDQLYKWNNIDAGDVKVGKTLQVKE